MRAGAYSSFDRAAAHAAVAFLTAAAQTISVPANSPASSSKSSAAGA